MYLEASAADETAIPGANIKVNIEALNRSDASISLQSVSYTPKAEKDSIIQLSNNKKFNFSLDLKIPNTATYTSPYWLIEKSTLGTYTINDQNLIGKPETPSAYNVYFNLEIIEFQ